MKTSIKINDQYIQKILLGSTPVQRIYQSGSIVYEAGESTPCFEVVETISEASGDYVDVYAWDTEKWYKKNNLNQYEEYGVIEHTDDLSELTYYTGKLVILDTTNHEYKWNGSQWVDLGECGVTIIHSPEYISRTSSYTGYVPLGDKFQENTVIEIDFQMTNDRGYAVIGDYWGNDNDDWRFFVNYSDGGYNGVNYDFDTTRIQTTVSNTKARFHLEIGNYYAKYYGASSNLITGTRKTNFNRPNQMYLFHMDGQISQVNEDYGNVYMLKITQDGVLSKDFIPWTDMNGNYGFYDLLSNTVYPSTGNMTGSNNVTDIQIGEPVEDYPTKVAPPNNVHYDTLEELELMECPWIGMQATVGQNYELYLYWNNQWNKMPCFEVVDTISEASGKYIDVYATDTQKWYKKNNLNQYEEYGIVDEVADLSTLTYYTGKLTVCSVDDHEYKWNGSSWIDLGSCGRTCVYEGGDGGIYKMDFGYHWGYKSKAVLRAKKSSAYSEGVPIQNGSSKGSSTSPIELGWYSNGFFLDRHNPQGTSNYNCGTTDFDKRTYKWSCLNNYTNQVLDFELQFDIVNVKNTAGQTIATQGNVFSSIGAWYGGLYYGTIGVNSSIGSKLYSLKIYNEDGELRHDFIFRINNTLSETQKLCLYDKVTDTEYQGVNNSVSPLYNFEGTITLPEQYDTKVAPADNVHYNTLEELELMECPWYGMTATIGVNYEPYIYTNLGWIRKS